MTRSIALMVSATALATALVAGAAGSPSIDPTKSTIIVTFRQENVPVDDAKFAKPPAPEVKKDARK